jgi:hypothetical protein
MFTQEREPDHIVCIRCLGVAAGAAEGQRAAGLRPEASFTETGSSRPPSTR